MRGVRYVYRGGEHFVEEQVWSVMDGEMVWRRFVDFNGDIMMFDSKEEAETFVGMRQDINSIIP